MNWVQAGMYFIQPTKQSQLVFEVEPIDENEPKDPLLVYDGNEHAVLYRNQEKGLILDYINPQIRSDLFKAQTVDFCEYDAKKEDIVRIYTVPIKHVKKLDVRMFSTAKERE